LRDKELHLIRRETDDKGPHAEEGRLSKTREATPGKVVASVMTKRQSQPVKTQKMTKPKNKPVPKMVRKWVPKIAMPAKSVDLK
jgi:hypothetical protein